MNYKLLFPFGDLIMEIRIKKSNYYLLHMKGINNFYSKLRFFLIRNLINDNYIIIDKFIFHYNKKWLPCNFPINNYHSFWYLSIFMITNFIFLVYIILKHITSVYLTISIYILVLILLLYYNIKFFI